MDAPVSELPHGALASRRRLSDRIGDIALHLLTGAAALGSVRIPVTNQFGALAFLYGTAVTSFAAVLIAGPLAIAIALFLTELAPAAVRGIVGSLGELP